MSDWNPRKEEENLGIIAAWHNRYDFNDKGVETSKEYGVLGLYVDLGKTFTQVTGSGPDVLEHRLAKSGAVIILPLYLYDHGVQVLSTESFIGRAQHAEWDSGRVGFIFTTRERILAWYGLDKVTNRVSKNLLAKAEALLKAEVEAYSNYLNGWDEEEEEEEEEELEEEEV